MVLDKKALFATVPTKDIAIERFGGDVRIRALSARAGLAFSKRHGELAGENGDVEDLTAVYDLYADIICQCVVDDHGVRYLDDAEGRQFVLGQPMVVLEQLGSAIFDFSGMNTTELEQKKSSKEAST